MKKFSKKLNLNKREITDLTAEEQVKLEGGTTYTCGSSSSGKNRFVKTNGSFGCHTTVYGTTCMFC
jgi:hypothetical protein